MEKGCLEDHRPSRGQRLVSIGPSGPRFRRQNGWRWSGIWRSSTANGGGGLAVNPDSRDLFAALSSPTRDTARRARADSPRSRSRAEPVLPPHGPPRHGLEYRERPGADLGRDAGRPGMARVPAWAKLTPSTTDTRGAQAATLAGEGEQELLLEDLRRLLGAPALGQPESHQRNDHFRAPREASRCSPVNCQRGAGDVTVPCTHRPNVPRRRRRRRRIRAWSSN